MPYGRRFVARNSDGEFISNVDAGRSISADKRKPAKSSVKAGFGQMGDIRGAESVASRISSWEDEHPGYKIKKPNPNSTGYLTMTKSGPRRVNDTNIGGHGRYGIYFKGDRVGTWTPSKGSSKKGANSDSLSDKGVFVWYNSDFYDFIDELTPYCEELDEINKIRSFFIKYDWWFNRLYRDC